jgi:hypothetical protein
MEASAVLLVAVAVLVLLVVVSLVKAVQIIPQATASGSGSTCASRWSRSRRSR